MVYNKELNITEIDVENQNNIDTLNEWMKSLESQIASILIGSDGWTTLPQNKKIAYQCMVTLRKTVKRKIGECWLKIKEENGWKSEKNKRKDRTLSMVFMKIAKKELSKEEYFRLLSIAQNEING